MILMSKCLLFLLCTLLFSLEVWFWFCFVLYLHLDYIISFCISLVSSEFITVSTPNALRAVYMFSPHIKYLCSASSLVFFRKSIPGDFRPALFWMDGLPSGILGHPRNSLCLSYARLLSSSIPLIRGEHMGTRLPENEYREIKQLRPVYPTEPLFYLHIWIVVSLSIEF